MSCQSETFVEAHLFTKEKIESKKSRAIVAHQLV